MRSTWYPGGHGLLGFLALRERSDCGLAIKSLLGSSSVPETQDSTTKKLQMQRNTTATPVTPAVAPMTPAVVPIAPACPSHECQESTCLASLSELTYELSALPKSMNFNESHS